MESSNAQRRPPRERLIDAAITLFAARGYTGASIAAIEEAAGFSPGSGSLYSHFRSKEEVLEAAFARLAGAMEDSFPIFEMLPLGDLSAELTMIARGALMMLDSSKDLVRIILKEGDALPQGIVEVQRRMWDRSRTWLAAWLAAKVRSKEVARHDSDALAALGSAALTGYWIETVYLETDSAPSQDSIVDEWVSMMLHRLRPTTSPPRRRSRSPRAR